MESVRVYAKAQNRTALGIMHAYMLMNPQATLADLRKAFPNSLNPDRGVPEVFIYAEEKGTEHDWDGFFKAEDEVLAMGDDRQVSVVKMWTKPKGFGKKGSFRLEYLNGWTPPSKKGKSSLLWLWILLILLVVGGLVYYFTR